MQLGGDVGLKLQDMLENREMEGGGISEEGREEEQGEKPRYCLRRTS